MRKVLSVAHNTFIEGSRDRVLYSLLLFAILAIISSLVFARVSGEQYNDIVKDLGLSVISVIGILISVFLAIRLMYKDLKKSAVYNIFSKPVKRYEFIIGKYLGLGITLFVITLGMALILFLLVLLIDIRYGLSNFYYGGHHYAEFFKAVYFQYLVFLIIIGAALFFSSFATPLISALLTLFIIAIGRFSNEIRLFVEETKHPAAKLFSELIYRAVPSLEKFDVRGKAIYDGKIETELVINNTAYALIYIIAFLVLSIIIFERKEFK